MKLKNFLNVIPVLLMFFACSTTKTTEDLNKQVTKVNTEDDKLPEITGPWLWVKTNCCGRMQTTSYDTAALPTILQIGEKGKFTKTKGDDLLQSTTYTYFYDESLGSNVLKLADRNMPGIIHFREDTLLIDYGYMDLQTEYYIRFTR